jgi:predicted porin
MKKLLIATAALAMVAGTAQAQSSVTISGLIEAGYTSKEVRAVGSTTQTTTQNAVTGGHFGTPNITIRGTEDLGGGLKASFLFQEEFEATTGSTEVTNSTTSYSKTFVTLEGGFGSISLGKMDMATRDLGGVYRFMGDIGRFSSTVNTGGNLTNTIQYVSPAFNGFRFSAASSDLQKTVSKGADTNTDPVANTGFGINGTLGKLKVAVSQEDTKLLAASVGAQQAQLSQLSYGGSYDFGVVRIGAAVVNQEAKLTTGAAGGERTAMTINLAAPVTNLITVGGSFASYEVSPAAGGTKPKADVMTLAAQYSLSKRTNVYGSYQTVKNNGTANAMAAFGATGVNSGDPGSSRGLGVVETTGATTSGFGVSVVHAF